jgi:NAD-dependent SIR2 family protein deacetylase
MDHVDAAAAAELSQWLAQCGGPVLALTGAGISTDSGIPDYRGPNGSYMRGHKPMWHDEFMGSHRNQQRYWSRSTAGWEFFSAARPNAAHAALARLEAAGKLSGVITQNVDSLHQRAGSAHVVDLHGVNARTVCMSCGAHACRQQLHSKLSALNQDWLAAARVSAAAEEAAKAAAVAAAAAAPQTWRETAQRADGDAELGAISVEGFHVCGCEACGGVIKPDVVFFGEKRTERRNEGEKERERKERRERKGEREKSACMCEYTTVVYALDICMHIHHDDD